MVAERKACAAAHRVAAVCTVHITQLLPAANTFLSLAHVSIREKLPKRTGGRTMFYCPKGTLSSRFSSKEIPHHLPFSTHFFFPVFYFFSSIDAGMNLIIIIIFLEEKRKILKPPTPTLESLAAPIEFPVFYH